MQNHSLDTEGCDLCSILVDDSKQAGVFMRNESTVGLIYSDQSYPFRSIVVFRTHVEEILDMSRADQHALQDSALLAGRAISQVTAAPRMNYAVLGNRIGHVHWHVIPRQVDDPQWGKAPWPHPVEREFDEKVLNQRATLVRQAIATIEDSDVVI